MDWCKAIRCDCLPGLLGVLIRILPNLRELRCSAGWLMDFPIFAQILGENQSAIPEKWTSHAFLASPMKQLQENLEVLEIPADRTAIDFESQISAIYDFRKFANLEELGINQKALWYLGSVSPVVFHDIAGPLSYFVQH